jgi:uncharacterized damage-inducible protein DinB
MSDAMKQSLVDSYVGEGAHVSPMNALDSLSAAKARTRVHPELHTIWEELAHIVYWQDWMLKALRGTDPKIPARAAEGWPKMPPARGAAKAWAELVAHFEKGLRKAARLARTKHLCDPPRSDAKRTYGSTLVTLADHNAYHIGQIVTLRQMLGVWPPPSGGCTW